MIKPKSLVLWIVAIGPMTLLVAAVAYGSWCQYRAWSNVQQQLAESSAAQAQYYQAMIAQRVHSSEEEPNRASRINQLTLMSQSLDDQIKRYDLGTWINMPLTLSSPHISIPDAPLAKIVAKNAEPMIDLLEELLGEVDRINLLTLEETENILDFCFRYSFYNHETDEAKRVLTLISKLTLCSPTDAPANSQQSLLVEYNRLYMLFQNSLAYDVWTTEQLAELSEVILKPLDISARLEASHRHQAESAANSVSQRIAWLQGGYYASPLQRMNLFAVDFVYLENLLQAARQSDGIDDVTELVKSIEAIEQMRKQKSLVPHADNFAVAFNTIGENMDASSTLLQNVNFAFNLAITEDNRRLTLLAVEIKQFETHLGRWPHSLDELVDDEFDKQNLRGVDGHPFQYRINIDFFREAASSDLVGNPEQVEAVAKTDAHLAKVAILSNHDSLFWEVVKKNDFRNSLTRRRNVEQQYPIDVVIK